MVAARHRGLAGDGLLLHVHESVELGVVALVAIAVVRARSGARGPGGWLAWTGLVGVLVRLVITPSPTPSGHGRCVAGPLAELLVAFGAAPGGPGVRWAWAAGPRGSLGRISYSLYLWHWPVVVVCWSVLGEDSLTATVVALVLSVGLATVSYYSIEQPVLHSRWLLGGRRAPARADAATVHQRGRVVAVSASALVVLVAATLTVMFPPGRLDARAVAAADAALRVAQSPEGDADPLTRELRLASTQLSWPQDLEALDELPDYLDEQWSDGCFDVGEWNASQCRFGAQDAERRAVVLGDSIAGAWLPGLRAGLEPQGWSVQTLTIGQCPNIDAPTLYRNRTFVECAEHRDWALEFIAETKPDLVVLSDTCNTDLADPAADEEQVWRAGLTTVVDRVRASGARVALLTAPPSGASLPDVRDPVQRARKLHAGPARALQDPARDRG